MYACIYIYVSSVLHGSPGSAYTQTQTHTHTHTHIKARLNSAMKTLFRLYKDKPHVINALLGRYYTLSHTHTHTPEGTT